MPLDISISSHQPEAKQSFLSTLPPAMQPIVEQAFHAAIIAGLVDPSEVVKAVLSGLRTRLQGRWQPGRDAVRTTIILLMAHPTEMLELATSLLSQKEGARGR